MIRCTLALLRRLMGGVLLRILLLHVLLLRVLLPSLITATEPSHETAHRRPGRGAFASISRDSPTHRSERCTTTSTSSDVPLRWLIYIRRRSSGHRC